MASKLFSLLRAPLMAAGAGVGASAYISTKIDEMTPSWAKGWKLPDLTLPKLPEMSIPEVSALEQELPKELPIQSQPMEPPKPSILEQVKKLEVSPVAPLEPMGDNHLMGLTKRLIEIRNLLKHVETDSAIQLPSIVVVGSQSSGKSSVLEAIVGQEFLPKGSNMVTRRPIELTLINTPESEDEYAEFPALKLGKIKSFQKVQKTLTDLNLAVSDEECVSKQPIELKIYSPNIPDLTLVDLPGYIQVTTKNQPKRLKEKIAELCEEYIQEPNIILAVCAADVDLANSEALRSSLKVDPFGKRTIGVVTKMDLVEPQHGSAILKNKDYPLQLGYIGVVNKSNGDSKAMIRSENAFFKKHASIYDSSMVGSGTLRLRLMKVLETHMARSLENIVDKVADELDTSRYQFKVHYNDRRITPESYVADSMDVLRQKFKEFTKQFDKQTVAKEINGLLEDRMIEISQNLYWDDKNIMDLPTTCTTAPLWDAKISQASSQLTRSGVGKSTVDLVVNLISSKIQEITSVEPWSYHKNASDAVLKFATDLLRSKYYVTIDQVENTIKPYKFEVDCTEQEWSAAKDLAVNVIHKQIQREQEELKKIRGSVGRRKLKQSIKYVEYLDKIKNTEIIPAKADLPQELLDTAREALFCKSKLRMLQFRLAAIKSGQCGSKQNKNCCPEVFLEVVAQKLSSTASMFINLELLNEFFFQLPREVDNKLYYSLNRDQIRQFCMENPAIADHIKVQERNEILEEVMKKLGDLRRHA